MTATIAKNEIEVSHCVRPDVNREFLTVKCPEGWDDVKKLTNKVLTYEGRKFVYCSWNSDRNVANFSRLLSGGETNFATIG
jgi:hypothetical protein